jgi:hypothetical protein
LQLASSVRGARWHARFVLEAEGINLGDARLALAVVGACRTGLAALVLDDIARRYRVPNLGAALCGRFGSNRA